MRCSYCSSEVPSDAKFCKNCGAPIVATNQFAQNSPMPPTNLQMPPLAQQPQANLKGYMLLLIAGITLAVATMVEVCMRLIDIVSYADYVVLAQVAPNFLLNILYLTTAALAVIFCKKRGGAIVIVLVLAIISFFIVVLWEGSDLIWVLTADYPINILPTFYVGMATSSIIVVSSLLIIIGAIRNLLSPKPSTN